MKIYATRHMKRPDIYRYELFNHLQLQCSLRCVNFASRKRTETARGRAPCDNIVRVWTVFFVFCSKMCFSLF